MASQPPSFGSVKYWDERFEQEPEAFEWLREPTVFRGALEAALDQAEEVVPPRILHVGCGTSNVSFFLRTLVAHPSQVHNVDFSRGAVTLGKQRECELLQGDGVGPEDRKRGPMRWSQLDLLSFEDVRTLAADAEAGTGPYHVIVDKSTSDAVACGEDIRVTLPHFLEAGVNGRKGEAVRTRREEKASVRPREREQAESDGKDIEQSEETSSLPTSISTHSSASAPVTPPQRSTYVHPLHVLALHLAYVTAPGGRWIALSYAQHRFPFLHPHPRRAEDGRLRRWVVEAGFVHPQRLWRVVQQRDLRPKEEMMQRRRRRRRRQRRRQQGGEGIEGGDNGDIADAVDSDDTSADDDDGGDDDDEDEDEYSYSNDNSNEDEEENGSPVDSAPRIVHTLYVLERTNVPLRAPPLA